MKLGDMYVRVTSILFESVYDGHDHCREPICYEFCSKAFQRLLIMDFYAEQAPGFRYEMHGY